MYKITIARVQDERTVPNDPSQTQVRYHRICQFQTPVNDVTPMLSNPTVQNMRGFVSMLQKNCPDGYGLQHHDVIALLDPKAEKDEILLVKQVGEKNFILDRDAWQGVRKIKKI